MLKKFLLIVAIASSLFAKDNSKEKMFVVERESNSVAVIEDDKLKEHMKNMHNMNHGII